MTDHEMTRSEANADAKAAKARAKALRPWYKKKRFILPLILVAIIGVSVAAGGGDDDSRTSTSSETDDGITGAASEADDVTITKCEKSQFGANVALEVVNDSSKRSSYVVSLTIEDQDGTKIGEGSDFINNVEPGQKAVSEPLATYTGDPASITCRLTDVDRTASD